MNLLDQFYTKPEIAKRFVDKVSSMVNFEDYDNIIEPSAGSGRILDFLPEDKRIGIDLDPKREDIEKIDFFHYHFPEGKNLVIGNPPFGRQSKMAIQFFNRCAQNADTIAFIIPRTWNKWRVQNQLHPSFQLYWSCVLQDDAFTSEDEDYSVGTVAQLWSKEEPNYFGGYESWHPLVTQEVLDDIDNYLLKHGNYEKPATLF